MSVVSAKVLAMLHVWERGFAYRPTHRHWPGAVEKSSYMDQKYIIEKQARDDGGGYHSAVVEAVV